jgi:hypothetical protein
MKLDVEGLIFFYFFQTRLPASLFVYLLVFPSNYSYHLQPLTTLGRVNGMHFLQHSRPREADCVVLYSSPYQRVPYMPNGSDPDLTTAFSVYMIRFLFYPGWRYARQPWYVCSLELEIVLVFVLVSHSDIRVFLLKIRAYIFRFFFEYEIDLSTRVSTCNLLCIRKFFIINLMQLCIELLATFQKTLSPTNPKSHQCPHNVENPQDARYPTSPGPSFHVKTS